MSTRKRKAYEVYGDYHGISKGQAGEILFHFVNRGEADLDQDDLMIIGIESKDTIRKVRKKICNALNALDPDFRRTAMHLKLAIRLLQKYRHEQSFEEEEGGDFDLGQSRASDDLRDEEYLDFDQVRGSDSLRITCDLQNLLQWLDEDE